MTPQRLDPKPKRDRPPFQRAAIILRRSGLKTVKSWVNPAYHLRKIREDLSSAAHGLKVWHLGRLLDDPPRFATAARGKFFATFVIAGACASVALPIGHAAQASSSNFWTGMFVTIGVGHGIANLGFWIIWGTTNRDLYRSINGFGPKFVAIAKDVLPLLGRGLQIAIPLTAVALLLNVPIVGAVEKFLPASVRLLPVGVIMAIVDALMFNSHYVRLMGNLFEKYSNEMAKKYCVTN
jgi:hypothetical protein